MTSSDLAHAAPPRDIRHGLELAGFALALAYAVFLAGSTLQGFWLVDGSGQIIANDFVNVWAGGKLALEGHAAAAYDWTLHREVEVAAVGHNFEGYYGWHYPPTFLFVAAALAALPYLAAEVVWLAVTLPIYVATVRAIIGERLGIVLACAFPGVIWNISAGQNGFLTAALLGGILVNLTRRPLIAGVCLGLLAYKPQFGILFPLVLALDGRWRAIASASVTAALMMIASWLAFGAETWRAFFHSIPHTTQAVLVQGEAGFNKLQSVFGLVRWLGGGVDAGWIGQFSVLAIAAIATLWLWRRDVPFALKAAALALSSLLATPYLYVYDFPVLAIALGFLARQRAFDALEKMAVVAASLSIIVFLGFSAPIGLVAIALVAALIVRRVTRLAEAPALHVAMQRA
ncbi:MAG TPA: glycosyltransferase family 87 protein [Rhizomicrobium sp.]|nr:glycosyltransferase family 87 protein [Rhizomicrobium sp.]